MKSPNHLLIAGVCIAALATANLAVAQQPKPQQAAQQQQHEGQQNSPQNGGMKHKKGERLNDWKTAPKVDYRKHKLKTPPKGYEWHEVNGDYVMVAVATGVIASIIAAH